MFSSVSPALHPQPQAKAISTLPSAWERQLDSMRAAMTSEVEAPITPPSWNFPAAPSAKEPCPDDLELNPEPLPGCLG